MIYIPFVYFTLLTLYLFNRQKTIDLATVIAAIYAISGLFSIVLYENASWYSFNYIEVDALPTFLYCTLLTLCILPISKNNFSSRVTCVPIRKRKLLKILALISFIWFVLIVVLGRNALNYVLTSDMADVRADIYKGYGVGGSWMSAMPAPLRLVFAFLNLLFGCPWVLIFLGFYTFSDINFPRVYSYFFILASLSGPIYGIMGADRSATVYWIIAIVSMLLLFYDKIDKKTRRTIILILIIIGGFLVAYLVAMTVSRFEFRDSIGGIEGSIVAYAGQSFLNFCYFLENYEVPYKHWGIIFPFISDYIFGIPSGGTVIQEEMTRLTGIETGVFYTFMGQIMVGLGQFWAIVITIIFAISSYFSLYYLKRQKRVDVKSLYLYFSFASVPLLGVFVHYYASPGKTFSLIIMYFVIKYLK